MGLAEYYRRLLSTTLAGYKEAYQQFETQFRSLEPDPHVRRIMCDRITRLHIADQQITSPSVLLADLDAPDEILPLLQNNAKNGYFKPFKAHTNDIMTYYKPHGVILGGHGHGAQPGVSFANLAEQPWTGARIRATATSRQKPS
jgi:hypothetical protein